jgi:hypothetical protein
MRHDGASVLQAERTAATDGPTRRRFRRSSPWIASLLFIPAALVIPFERPTYAQSRPAVQTQHEASFWPAYMASWRFASKWGLWFDTHYNTESFLLFRGGLIYWFEDGPSITAGYTHGFLNAGDGSLDRQELRPWAQVMFPFHLGEDWSFSQRVRIDYRFRQNVQNGEVTDGFGFTGRYRFQSTLTYWLPKIQAVGQPFLQVADEVLVNLIGNTDDNILDQNRVSFMVGLKTPPFTFRIGYMNRFVPNILGSVSGFEHSFVLWVNHDIDTRTNGTENPEEGNP